MRETRHADTVESHSYHADAASTWRVYYNGEMEREGERKRKGWKEGKQKCAHFMARKRGSVSS